MQRKEQFYREGGAILKTPPRRALERTRLFKRVAAPPPLAQVKCLRKSRTPRHRAKKTDSNKASELMHHINEVEEGRTGGQSCRTPVVPFIRLTHKGLELDLTRQAQRGNWRQRTGEGYACALARPPNPKANYTCGNYCNRQRC